MAEKTRRGTIKSDPEDENPDSVGADDLLPDELQSDGQPDGDALEDEEDFPATPSPGRSPSPEGEIHLPPLPERVGTPVDGTPPRDVQKLYDRGSETLAVVIKKVNPGYHRPQRCSKCGRLAADHKGKKVARCKKERKNVDPEELNRSYKNEYFEVRRSYKREMERQENSEALEEMAKKLNEMEEQFDGQLMRLNESRERVHYLEEARLGLRELAQGVAEKSERYVGGAASVDDTRHCVDVAYASLRRESRNHKRLMKRCRYLNEDGAAAKVPEVAEEEEETEDEASLSSTEESGATSVEEEEEVVIENEEVAQKGKRKENAKKEEEEESKEKDIIICSVDEKLEDSDSETGQKPRRDWKEPERRAERKKPEVEVRPEDVAKFKAAIEEKKKSLNKAKEQIRLKEKMEECKGEWRELEWQESRLKKAASGKGGTATFTDEASTHPIRRMMAPKEMAPRGRGVLGAPSVSEEPIRPRKSLGVGSSGPYPGFRDPDPGTELSHRIGEGAICGGKGNQDNVIKAQKLVKITFRESDDCFEWLEKKRKMMNQMEYLYPDLEIYDLIAIFQSRATEHVRTFEPLLKKQKHFTSFTHFIKEFEKKSYPNIKNEVQTRFSTVTQKETGQNIYQFYLEFLDLLAVLGWRADDHVQTFLRKLKSEEIRLAVRNEFISTGERTLEGVQKHASQIETRMEMDDAEERRLRDAEIGDVSVDTVGMERGRGMSNRGSFKAKRGFGRGRMQGGRHAPYQTSRSSSSSSSKESVGEGDGYEAKISYVNIPHRAFDESEFEEIKAECAKRMHQRNLHGCGGCLGFKHQMQPDLANCMYQACIFCGKGFRAEGAHVAALCDAFPANGKGAAAIMRQRRLEWKL